MKNNIVLIIGENKNNSYFQKSVDVLSNRSDIDKIILVTWKTVNIGIIKSNLLVDVLLIPQVKLTMGIEYQKYLYDIGVKYINDNYKTEDTYVLKTRMDVLISNQQLDYIFSQNYQIEHIKSELFKYKIWIAWTHITKPFYVEDCCFYSHISVMPNLSPYVGELFIDQGHSHIRWFLLLARIYNLYNDENLYDEYKNMNAEFTLNETKKEILYKYIKCIKNQFIIMTVKDGIYFRYHSGNNFYKKHSNKITEIIEKKHPTNQKLVYNSTDFFDINII